MPRYRRSSDVVVAPEVAAAMKALLKARPGEECAAFEERASRVLSLVLKEALNPPPGSPAKKPKKKARAPKP